MIKKLPKDFQSIILQNNGLSQYLSNLQKGRASTPRSWLYEDKEPSWILSQWKEKLSCLEQGDTFEQRVFQFDTSQEEKWGPQGGIAPMSELLESVVLPTFKDDSPHLKAFDTDEWQDAMIEVESDFADAGIRALRPASLKRVVDDMRARDTLESNSGWPLFTRRNKPEVIKASIADAESGEWKTFPAIALFRNYRQKTRMVWMFPMSANLVEGSFFQPFQSAIMKQETKHLPFYAPWKGFEEVRKLVTNAYANNFHVYASDFSQTDAHFRWDTTRAVLPVFQFVFQKQFGPAIEESLKYMHSIPLIISQTEFIVGEHGVSSGSNWTNFVETIFDNVFSEYVSILENGVVDGLYAIGDDMAWISRRYDDAFAERLEKYGEDVGQQIKAEKTTCERDWVVTLQRLFQRGYSRPDKLLRGVYSTIRALNSSVYPERFHNPKDWSSDMFCARQYMILENCVDHPLFEEFVKFVVAGQKDLIPFAKKSSSELARIHRESKLLPGLNPTYNQEKRDSSLENFESVKLARIL